MNKVKCETCGKKKNEEFIIKVETSEKTHLFCINCIKRTYEELKLIPNKPLEVEDLIKTLKKVLKDKGELHDQVN